MADPAPAELTIAYYETAFEQYQRAIATLQTATNDAADAGAGWQALNAARIRVYEKLIAEHHAEVEQIKAAHAEVAAVHAQRAMPVCTDPDCTIPRRPGFPMHGPHDFRAATQ